MTELTDVDRFKQLVSEHDITYDYSDDGATYRRGSAQRTAINELAAKIDPKVAAEIWNAAVDRKLIERARQNYYWPVPT